jgi:hypothetical protein
MCSFFLLKGKRLPGHYESVRTILCLCLLFGPQVWAEEASDRAEIQNLISSLNEARDAATAKPLSSLFTADADRADIDLLSRLLREPIIPRRPWSEEWPQRPRISYGAIRFVTPDVALADARYRPFGPSGRSFPADPFVMKKEGGTWKIASFRVLMLMPSGPLVRPIVTAK